MNLERSDERWELGGFAPQTPDLAVGKPPRSPVWTSHLDEKIFELAIDSGADECISHDEFHEIQCPMSDIYNVKKKLETVVANFISTKIEWVVLNNANVVKDKQETVIEFLESLEDDDDVQNVFSNANFENN